MIDRAVGDERSIGKGDVPIKKIVDESEKSRHRPSMGSAGFQSGLAIIHDAKPHVTSTDSPFKSGEAHSREYQIAIRGVRPGHPCPGKAIRIDCAVTVDGTPHRVTKSLRSVSE